MSDHTTDTQQTAENLDTISDAEVEALARAMATQKLAEKRANELIKQARDEGENLLEKAAGGLSNAASKASKSLSNWKAERQAIREEREERERAAEIAYEKDVEKYRAEARRQIEQERLEAQEAKGGTEEG